MKQLLILSGKGGTGKTTVAGAFIRLSAAEALADCDVDAPNLHLIISENGQPESSIYYGMDKAFIDNENCISCGNCLSHCQFNAIHPEYSIDPHSCEGCGTCQLICPVDAISLKQFQAGDLMLYKNKKTFSTAKLKMGSGNSGLLVTSVKKQLIEHISDAEFAIIDGSPGIGCPVIASLNGADTVLIVAEPSVSGFSDMVRIVKTAQQFKIKIALCINKYDINIEQTKKIEAFCQEENIFLAGRIPYDSNALTAINQNKTIIDIDCAAGTAIRDVFNNLTGVFFNENSSSK